MRFLRNANGSAQEVEYAADLATDLALAPAQKLQSIMSASVEIQKMLRSLVASLKQRVA